MAPIRFIVILAAVPTFTFHAFADQGASRPTPAGEAELRVGRAAFQKVCAECHGSKGRGDGEKAKKLGFAPRNFTLGAFKCRCTPSGHPPTDEDLNRTITRGLPGTPMEGHGKDLTDAERRALVRFIKTLSPKFSAGNLSACQASPNSPPVSPELIAEGGQLYRLMQCGKCHGTSGRGDGPAAATLKDDWGLPIRPYDFVERREFKCGNDDRDVFRTLRTGMTGTPMPSFDEALGFAKDSFSPEQLRTLGSPTETGQLQAYLATQPDANVFKKMAAEDRLTLINRRTWSLVQYVRSLLAR